MPGMHSDGKCTILGDTTVASGTNESVLNALKFNCVGGENRRVRSYGLRKARRLWT